MIVLAVSPKVTEKQLCVHNGIALLQGSPVTHF